MDDARLVCVVGSLNDDTTLQVVELPRPGETVLAHDRQTSAGGKGANQASAAAALGAQVAMVGAVGADENGRAATEALRVAGVDVSGVRQRPDRPTGQAIVIVDDGGENSIVVSPGANATLTAAEVVDSLNRLKPAYVLVQLEVPVAAVAEAARSIRNNREVVVVLNPAPMPDDPSLVRQLLADVDVVVPNRGELGRMAGHPEPTCREDVDRCVRALNFDGAVIVTMGADGALCWANASDLATDPMHVQGQRVEAVDASGAGDVFCACLVAHLAKGVRLVDAVRQANAAAARSTTHRGARVPPNFR